MVSQQQANTPLIVTIGVVSGLMLIVIMVGIEAWFKYEEKQELAVKWEDSRNVQLDTLRAEQAHVSGYHWADPGKQVAMIPVTEAMRILVEKKGVVPATQPAAGSQGKTQLPAKQPEK